MTRPIDGFRKKDVSTAASLYHMHSISCIPLRPRSKVPSIQRWKEYQKRLPTTDDIRALFGQHDGNLAIVLGAVSGNLVCVDLDGPDALTRFDEKFKELRAGTLTVRTGNGLHLYFYVQDMPGNEKWSWGDHAEIAIRGTGQYVVAPPSEHENGTRYEVIEGTEIKRLANLTALQWWLKNKRQKQEKQQQQKSHPAKAQQVATSASDGRDRAPKQANKGGTAYGLKALNAECTDVANAAPGGRNNRLNKAAFSLGRLVGGEELDEQQTRTELLRAAIACGLTEDEATATIDSAMSAGMAQPRTAPKKQTASSEVSRSESTQETTSTTRSYKPTDDELGDRIREQIGDKYAYFRGQWHRYDNGVWVPDEGFEALIWDTLIDAKTEGIKPSHNKVSSVEKYLQMRARVPDEMVDCGDGYINLQNGLFNTHTLKLENHRKELYLTSQLPFAHDPKARMGTWQGFLWNTVQAGDQPDIDLQDLLQEAVGYSLTNDTSHRVSFWLVGESGTGKSVLINTIAALAGNAHTTIDLDEMSRSGYQLADIAGKRVVTFTEPRSNSVLADNHYKRLVSQDVITARQIFGKPFRFVPKAKVWGAMNETPRVLDRSDAVFNRVIIVPMNNVVPAEKRDPMLFDKLQAELPGIFNWAIRGLIRLRERGKFTQSLQSENARVEYRRENDIESAFVDDWCERTGHIGAQRLYDAYNAWCKRNGVMPKSSVKVARDWQRLGFTKKRTNYGMVYMGVQLNQMGNKSVA